MTDPKGSPAKKVWMKILLCLVLSAVISLAVLAIEAVYFSLAVH